MNINVEPVDKITQQFDTTIDRIEIELENYTLGESLESTYIRYKILGTEIDISGRLPLSKNIKNSLKILTEDIKNTVLKSLNLNSQ